jgi:predicted DCC family thiol-disulfide oxidoreductase YuxK
MQSEEGKGRLEQYGYSRDFRCSIVLIEGGEKYSASDAVVRIFRRLEKPWSWLSRLEIIPRPVRNYFYFLVSRHRHRQWLQKLMKPH